MRSLLIVDPQLDFMPGGALEVPGGNAIVPVLNNIMDQFDLVVATQDWHPEGHGSFASSHKGVEPFAEGELAGLSQIFWPDHCVQGSRGAEFHPELRSGPIEAIFRKGVEKDIDSYSGFYDNDHRKDTGLAGYLKARGVEQLYVGGLAADVCVYFSLKDALKEGFTTYLIEDATRPLKEEDFAQQRQELTEKGLRVVKSSEL